MPQRICIPAEPFAVGTCEQYVDWLAQRCELVRTWPDEERLRWEEPQRTAILDGYALGRESEAP
jgi:hypothetical protein